MDKKLGRPTENPMTYVLKVRMDEDTASKLTICTEVHSVSKAEVIRRGIHREHKALKEIGGNE